VGVLKNNRCWGKASSRKERDEKVIANQSTEDKPGVRLLPEELSQKKEEGRRQDQRRSQTGGEHYYNVEASGDFVWAYVKNGDNFEKANNSPSGACITKWEKEKKGRYGRKGERVHVARIRNFVGTDVLATGTSEGA